MNQNLRKLIIRRSKRMMHALILCCVGQPLLMAERASGQSIHEVKISVDFKGAHILEALDEIERKSSFTFAYNKEMRALDTRITQAYQSTTVAQVLKGISKETGVSFHQVNSTITAMLAPRRTEKPKANSQKPKVDKQDRIISGKVTDENGEPLVGATVLLQGTKIGSITDADGNYRFSIPENIIESAEDDGEELILTVSYIGYNFEEVTIGNRATIDITLLPSVESLSEVIVSTGYYEVEQRFNPGKIAKIDAKAIEQQPIANPLQALTGRVAGAYIEQQTGVPGGGFNIRIRGQNSLFFTRNEPFYVIDGVPYPNTPIASGVGVSSTMVSYNPLSAINPNDIESIQILKDADATAIYGSRGANGVVLITTKKGTPGKIKLDINYSRAVGEVAERIDLLNNEQYLNMRLDAIENSGISQIDQSTLDRVFPDVYVWDQTRTTDWQEELLGGTSNQTNADFSLSGGSQQTSFVVGGTYFNETTVYPGDSDFERLSGRLNLNHKSLYGRFQADIAVNYSVTNSNLPFTDLGRIAYTLPPNAPALFDEAGNINWENGTWENPLANLEKEFENQNNNLISNLTLSYEIIEGLRIRAIAGFNNTIYSDSRIEPISSINPQDIVPSTTGQSLFATGSVETWNVEPQLEYFKESGKGELRVILGTTFQSTTSENERVTATGYSSDAFLLNRQAASQIDVTQNNFSEFNYNAFYARLNYVWDSKYILNLTGRRDGSSRFGPGEQFGNFGAVGAAWIFSEEGFIVNTVPFLSFGKLRVNYGITGSDNIGNYQYLESYSLTTQPYDDVAGLFITRLANPNFSWEETTKLDLGFELGFINDRFNLSTTYYRNQTTDQITFFPLSAVTGQAGINDNLPATVENRGWEFDFNSINIQSGDFIWRTNFNFTIPENELIEFDDIENSTFANVLEVGKPVWNGSSKVFQFTGINPETGLYTLLDANADGDLDFENDGVAFRDLGQDYYGGIENTFSYRGFQLSFHFQFVSQTTRSLFEDFGQTGGTASNQPVEVVNSWRNSGDVAPFQVYGRSNASLEAWGDFYRSSNAGIADASFVRLRNASLSYTFPESLISKFKAQNLRIYLEGQNLWTIAEFIGPNPESATLNVPPLRLFSAGIQVSF